MKRLGWLALLCLTLVDCKCKDTAPSGLTDVGIDAAETGCVDRDGDGYSTGLACDGAVNELDCDDNEPLANPGLDEVCYDDIDNNCDGTIDELCGDCPDGETRQCGFEQGECTFGTQTCRQNIWSECEGNVKPTFESCNGVDDDCDGLVDEDPLFLCSDGQYCNGLETCEDGECVGEAIDCSDLEGPCTIATCTEKGCDVEFRPDGDPCDDGLFCTDAGTCQAGQCVTTARDCSVAGDTCNDGVCDEENDACVQQPKADGTTCDDGMYCTIQDTCTSGVCGGSNRDCSGVADQCNFGVCDEATDACVLAPFSDGTTCDDGLFCTVGDFCFSGSCSPGGPRQCGALGGACRDGVCDEVNDMCTGDPLPDGTACDDTLFCTVGDSCVAGTCVGPAARNCAGSGDTCNDGVCNEMINQCVAQPKVDGTSCDDAAFCTVSDTCTAGVCNGAPRDCSAAADACNNGVCSEVNDICVPAPKSDGTACPDNAFCTVGEVCLAGACQTSARDCSAVADGCNDGVCNDVSDSCIPTPKVDGTICTDGLYCTVADSCSAGVCSGNARDCSAMGGSCSSGVCDEVANACAGTPLPDGTACDDDLWCTVSDSCAAGMCNGMVRDCSASGDQCNDGVCDEGIDLCGPSPKADGTGCDDTFYCTVGDVCTNGSCDGSARDCSAQDDQCNNGVCDDINNACIPLAVANGTACDDGMYCTVSDSCTSGACGGSLRDCSALDNNCNTGSCNEAAMMCDRTPRANGTPCDDGSFCSVNDICFSGSCNSGGARDCSGATMGDPCLMGVCDEFADVCDTAPNPGPACCNMAVDADLDGSNECDDCDDTNGSVFPGATETCNGVDDNCNGMIDEDFDLDSDGYSVCSPDPLLFDCDDSNPNVNPGMMEDCGPGNLGNGIDDDCDGYIDEGCNPCTMTDVDMDGQSECDGDCDDNDPDVYPGANEVCDGKDNDCNAFTVKNCDVSQPCNFASGADVCQDNRLCACIVNGAGNCTGNYVCTSFCNSSETGPVGNGCQANQTCPLDLLRSANVHGCSETTDTPGAKTGGETCSDDSECRSLNCDRICVGPGCNQRYCIDYCGSDAYCPDASTTCRLGRGGSNIDGQCWPTGGPLVGGSSVGAVCASDFSCNHGFCLTDPNDASRYCTEACCDDADCPGGYTCSVGADAISTAFVYSPPSASACVTAADCSNEGGICFNNLCAWRLHETSPMCVKDVAAQGVRVAGQACSSNAQCQSNFCENTLGVCVDVCCNDSTCPTGLTCELLYVETKTNQITQSRVCVNLSTDEVLQPQ